MDTTGTNINDRQRASSPRRVRVNQVYQVPGNAGPAAAGSRQRKSPRELTVGEQLFSFAILILGISIFFALWFGSKPWATSAHSSRSQGSSHYHSPSLDIAKLSQHLKNIGDPATWDNILSLTEDIRNQRDNLRIAAFELTAECMPQSDSDRHHPDYQDFLASTASTSMALRIQAEILNDYINIVSDTFYKVYHNLDNVQDTMSDSTFPSTQTLQTLYRDLDLETIDHLVNVSQRLTQNLIDRPITRQSINNLKSLAGTLKESQASSLSSTAATATGLVPGSVVGHTKCFQPPTLTFTTSIPALVSELTYSIKAQQRAWHDLVAFLKADPNIKAKVAPSSPDVLKMIQQFTVHHQKWKVRRCLLMANNRKVVYSETSSNVREVEEYKRDCLNQDCYVQEK